VTWSANQPLTGGIWMLLSWLPSLFTVQSINAAVAINGSLIEH